jgi:hypothetical protein
LGLFQGLCSLLPDSLIPASPLSRSQGDVDVASRFFTALASEPPGSRAALQEAVGSLAGAYASAAARRRAAQRQAGTAAGESAGPITAGAENEGGGDVEAKLQALLLGALTSDQPAVRLCAVQVGGRCFLMVAQGV